MIQDPPQNHPVFVKTQLIESHVSWWFFSFQKAFRVGIPILKCFSLVNENDRLFLLCFLFLILFLFLASSNSFLFHNSLSESTNTYHWNAWEIICLKSHCCSYSCMLALLETKWVSCSLFDFVSIPQLIWAPNGRKVSSNHTEPGSSSSRKFKLGPIDSN